MSLSNLLKSIGAGAGVGAGVGLLGGPFDEISVPVGAIVGGIAGGISDLLSDDKTITNNYNEQYEYSTNEITIGSNSKVGSVGLYNDMSQTSKLETSSNNIPLWLYGVGGVLLYIIYKEVYKEAK